MSVVKPGQVKPDGLRKLAALCKKSIPVQLHSSKPTSTSDVGEALSAAADEIERLNGIINDQLDKLNPWARIEGS